MAIDFRSQTNCLAEPQVQAKQGLAGAIVNRRDGLAGLRHGIEGAVGSDLDGPSRTCTGQCGTVIEDRVAIQVLTDDDVKWRTRGGDDEWAEAECVGQRNCAADKEAIANVEGRPPVVLHGVIGVHHELRGTGTSAESAAKSAAAASRRNRDRAARSEIAVGEIERVETKQRQLIADANPKIRDHLVLLENSAGVVLIDVGVPTKGTNIAGRVGARQGRIGIAQEELVLSSRVQIGDRDSGILGDLPLHAEGRFHGVGHAQVRLDLIDRRRGSGQL